MFGTNQNGSSFAEASCLKVFQEFLVSRMEEEGTLVDWFSSLSFMNKVLLVSSGAVAIGGVVGVYLWQRFAEASRSW